MIRLLLTDVQSSALILPAVRAKAISALPDASKRTESSFFQADPIHHHHHHSLVISLILDPEKMEKHPENKPFSFSRKVETRSQYSLVVQPIFLFSAPFLQGTRGAHPSSRLCSPWKVLEVVRLHFSLLSISFHDMRHKHQSPSTTSIGGLFIDELVTPDVCRHAMPVLAYTASSYSSSA